MRRKLTFILTLVMAFSIAATAWAGSFSDADYQGRIDANKASFFGFDVKKKHGVKKIANVHALVNLTCSNGQTTGPFNIAPNGSLRVHNDHAFSGTLVLPTENTSDTSDATARLKVSGKLGKHGRAKGGVAAFYDYTTIQFRSHQRIVQGTEPVSCSSEAQDWKAKRGAVINPKIVF